MLSMSSYFLLALLTYLIATQVQLSELRLLTGYYNYKLQVAQTVTIIAAVFTILIVACDIRVNGLNVFILSETVSCAFAYLFSEWLLAKLAPQQLLYTIVWRLLVVLIMVWMLSCWGQSSLLPFVVVGLLLRNSPLGVVHGKPFWLACRLHRRGPVMNKCRESAGPEEQKSSSERFVVTDYGIQPNTRDDVISKVQTLVNVVGQQGGGTIFFPRGRYLFNKNGKRQFLQINYSHITLEGEVDEQGRLLAELVNCGTTVQGERNPWLSPFFITTGEQLQPSNQFWGLNFRKPQMIHAESSSMSDPGSDGTLLTPSFATMVIADALAGETVLHVGNAACVGKHVLLGLYNTSEDGNLIRELLGVSELRPEWGLAQRAGKEEAPSFQWLTEVKAVIDEHTIELAFPLPRDCRLTYTPALFNVDMLEDIHIRNLRLNSRWNGLFHHHGLPLYYSVRQAQEMDYGWNGINMKRAAKSSIEHVELMNFTNPLYVQDSHSVCVANVEIGGNDGHQGVRAYGHTCDSLFEDIDLYCHFADMLGGEGNAYRNVFRRIRYLNPVFNPVDYDFHGFAYGPMAPPAYNVFEDDYGFRYIKGAGAIDYQPACGTGNTWRHCVFEGGQSNDKTVFFAASYRKKTGLLRLATAVGFTIVSMKKKKSHSLAIAYRLFRDKMASIRSRSIPREQHAQFFPGNTTSF